MLRNLRIMRPWAAMAGLLILAGCAADVTPEQPSMYFNMTEPGMKLDAQAAASMISLYRKNNGVGAVVIDPELMKVAETQSQAMRSPQKKEMTEVKDTPTRARVQL